MHLKVYKGDIKKLAVDVIVNAANSSLLGGRWSGRRHSKGGRTGIVRRMPESSWGKNRGWKSY